LEDYELAPTTPHHREPLRGALDMKSPIKRFTGVAAGAMLALGLAVPSDAKAKTFGIVIGVNEYQHLPELNGAVNDARDIAAALVTSGVDDVALLLDDDVTRIAVLQAWDTTIAKAKAGDTVIFSYAGHGGQELERVAGNEADGLDEVFLLAGFQVGAAGNAERIVDDELNRLFASAPHLNIIFVADSCHSGTMTRTFDSRAGTATTRLAKYGRIENDQLPEPDPQAAALDLDNMDHVVFFGAVQDHELAMEMPIDGASRGALSWSFARALRGHADQDGDALLTTAELETYLVEKVRTMSEGRQFPQVLPRARAADLALAVPRGGATAVADPAGAAAREPIRLHVTGTSDPEALVRKLHDAASATRDVADLIWDTAAGEVISSGGDVVARPGPGEDVRRVQPIVDKWLLLRDLRAFAEQQPLELRIDAGYAVHLEDTELAIQLTGHRYQNLTLFNLAVDGTVQFLVPWPAHANREYHGKLHPNRPFEFKLKVSAPFGADHLVALTAPESLKGLHIDLHDIDGTKSAAHLRGVIAKRLREGPFQLGYVGLFTAP
jgi:hypothetical protein